MWSTPIPLTIKKTKNAFSTKYRFYSRQARGRAKDGLHKGEKMRQTIEATIDEQGNVRLLEPIRLPKPRRAYVTILTDELDIPNTALLSEVALAEDWNRPEEDAAWSHLQ